MKRLVELASRQDLKAFEDNWMEALAGDVRDVPGLLEAISALEAQGQFAKASSYLQLLLPLILKAEGREDDAVLVLKRMAKISPREKTLRKHFIDVFRRKFGGHDGFDKLVRHSQIESDIEMLKAAERLESYLAFSPGSYVEHPAGWGVGVVKAIDSDDASVIIDFEEAKNHELELEMACRITRHLDADHFKAMRFDRRDQLLDMAEKDRVGLVKCVVLGRDRTTTVRDLRDRLTDGIISTKDWSRWWT
ncbi:MAG: hypothetical protein KDB53_11675, partial [Planctomycetes bacterium]|nr:hypothetical protein [Planctomycetota bacterium]